MANHKEVEGEHIFPQTHITELAHRWKELNAAGEHKKAMLVLEEIVVDSTMMFERLAQHEGFHLTVDLPILVTAAQSKVEKWLMAWNPKKGNLFTWMSKCSKNAFRSEVLKAAQYNRRFHVTSENLEKFFGSEDHAVDRIDVANVLRDKLKKVTVRWGDPQEIGAIRYLMACVLGNDEMKNPNACIRASSYAYGISFDLAKFFYQWVLMELREQMYQKIRIPFTEQDLFRHRYTYTPLVDLLQFITWDQMKKIIAIMGGTRLKIPTLAQLGRMNDEYELFEKVDAGDKDPASVEAVAKKKNKSPKNAQQVYEEMVNELHPKKSGDFPLYDSDNGVGALFDSQGEHSLHEDDDAN